VKKILFIDDDADIVTITTFILEDANYLVSTGGTAEEGLSLLEKEIPDLILLDLFLPKMQGWELSKQLKNDDRFKQIPIIFFTANAGIFKKTVSEMGGDDFIIKPYEQAMLLEKIGDFFK
jgi:DNA-binding response OmpR family regulator